MNAQKQLIVFAEFFFFSKIWKHGLEVECELFIVANGLAHKIGLLFVFYFFFADFS